MTKQHGILWLTAILCIAIQPIFACHYTCDTCSGDAYSECLTCPDNKQLYQPYSRSLNSGACTYVPLNNINVLGIIIAIALSVVCLILRSEEPFYFLLILQTAGLAYFVQIRWLPPLDYLFNALTYLMPLSAVLKYSKQPDQSLAQKSFRAADWYRSAYLPSNIALAGITSLVLIAFIIFVPCFKVIRRCLIPQRHLFLPNWLLQKISIVIQVVYLLLIQQCMMAISFGMGFGAVDARAVVVCVFYILSVLVFTVNLLFDPLHIFRNRGHQLTVILCKIITPIFLAGSSGSHFIYFILFFLFTLVQVAFTHRNKNDSQYNRMFYHRLVGVALTLSLIVTYILEYQVTQQTPTNIAGIICFILIIFSIWGFNQETVLILVNFYCDKPVKASDITKQKQTTEDALPPRDNRNVEETWDELNINDLRLQDSHQPSKKVVYDYSELAPYIVSDEAYEQGIEQHNAQQATVQPEQMNELEPIKVNQRKTKLSPIEQAKDPKLQKASESESCSEPHRQSQLNQQFSTNSDHKGVSDISLEGQKMRQSNLPFHNKSVRQRRKYKKK